jgi:arylsulfatase A
MSLWPRSFRRFSNFVEDHPMPFVMSVFRWIAGLVVLLVCVTSAVTAQAADRPPNVVLIYADDLGYGDLGCYGAQGWTTPHLDRLAEAGVRFTDFYVAQAVCSASRTALLTGCYPNRVGILGALGPQSKNGIHADESTIAEVLKPCGYATAVFGKWHLGHHPRFLPTRHGFDQYFGLPYSNDMWPFHPGVAHLPLDERLKRWPHLPLIEGDQIVNPQVTPDDQTQLTTWYTERAVKFIESHREQPFFLYLPHAMPHVPLFVSDKQRGKSEQGLYGDVIQEIDWSVGQITATIARLRLTRETLVIFASDNGPWLTYGNHAGGTSGLREGKGTSWDGGVRVPCVMSWPGKIPAGTVCREPAMTIDILPTLAKLAGAELPKLPIDGLDIWPLIARQTDAVSPHDALYFYWGQHLQAVRSGRWKLHFPHAYISVDAANAGADAKPGKPAPREIGLALFDLTADRAETTDVAEQHPDVVARLTALADKARTDLGDSATKHKGTGVRQSGMVE